MAPKSDSNKYRQTLSRYLTICYNVAVSWQWWSGLERFEPLLEGVPLTTNLLYDPVGPSGLSETPSGHSCPPQLQLKSIRTGVVLKGLEP